jgi:hypothetical protein
LFDRFATLGLSQEVTEFDINTKDVQLQADYTRDYLRFVFSQPQMTGFLMWGFWPGQHWIPDGAIVNLDWSLKPNGQVWVDTTQDQWNTDVTGTSWLGGQFSNRAYLGAYDVTVAYAGQTVVVPATLGGGGLTLNVTVPITQPNINIFQVNADAHVQRSMVRELVIKFNADVTISAGAFILTPQAGGAAIPISWTTQLVGGLTEVTLTPQAGGSFGDGRWRLETVASNIRSTTGNLLLAADRTDNFFRLFGDGNGDATVNAADYTLFRAALGTSVGQSGYRSYYDYNNDGVINAFDFTQFRANLGRTI